MRGLPAALVLLLSLSALTESGCDGEAGVRVVRGAGGRAGPAFTAGQRTFSQGRAGAAAALRCRVLRLGDRAVSWVRSSDLQILTHAGTVFTADSRVSAITGAAADDGPDEEQEEDEEDAEGAEGAERRGRRGGEARGAETVHTLRIERLRAADAGRYECQVNTEPKMSLFFNLTVADPWRGEVEVSVLGPRVVWVPVGGVARVSCEARYVPAEAKSSPDGHSPPSPPQAPPPPLRLRWRHEGSPLDTRSGGVSVETERWAGGASSRLTLGGLSARHAGRYVCAAGGAASAAVTLRLTPAPAAPREGESEAMQRDQGAVRLAGGGGSSGAPSRPAPNPAAVVLAALLASLALRPRPPHRDPAPT